MHCIARNFEASMPWTAWDWPTNKFHCWCVPAILHADTHTRIRDCILSLGAESTLVYRTYNCGSRSVQSSREHSRCKIECLRDVQESCSRILHNYIIVLHSFDLSPVCSSLFRQKDISLVRKGNGRACALVLYHISQSLHWNFLEIFGTISACLAAWTL